MRGALLFVVFLLAVSSVVNAQDASQTDWCGGGGTSGPVVDWADRFDGSAGVSWMAVPGQLALSSSSLAYAPEHVFVDSLVGTIGMEAGDLDGDGDIDVVGTAQTTGIVVWWENDGSNPPAWTQHTIVKRTGVAGVDVEDIDGDGRLDILITLVAPLNRILWRRNEGGDPIVWTNQVIQNPWYDAWEIATGDVNGDGLMDVMCTCWNLGDVAWWENGGDDPITWTQHLVDGSFSGAHSVRGADLDDDGDLDLVSAAAVADEIAIYWSDGADSISWTKEIVETDFIGARSVWIDDIDGDGDLDFAGISWESDLAWWANDGGDPIVWTRQTISTTCGGGHACCVADVNGDGRPDVLGACYVDDKLAWWENGGGDPIVWAEHTLNGNYDGSITVRAADLDGDGDLDPLGAAFDAGEFNWWEAVEFQASGALESSILDTDGMPPLASIDWTASEPAGTTLRFQVRSSNDPGNPGVWSADITAPGNLAGTLNRYVQYKILLDTAVPASSPILNQVAFGPALMAVESDSVRDPGESLRASPNPFNPQATLSFSLAREGRARLTVFDAMGRRVRSLADHVFPAGVRSLHWNGLDDNGRVLPSGIYWVRLDTPDHQETRKLVLLR